MPSGPWAELHRDVLEILRHQKRPTASSSSAAGADDKVPEELEAHARLQVEVFGVEWPTTSEGEGEGSLLRQTLLAVSACLDSLSPPLPSCTVLLSSVTLLFKDYPHWCPASGKEAAGTRPTPEASVPLTEFQPAWVLFTALWEAMVEGGAIQHEKERRIALLHQLLRTDVARHRAGRIWNTLAKDVEQVDKKDPKILQLALGVCRHALWDEDVGGGRSKGRTQPCV